MVHRMQQEIAEYLTVRRGREKEMNSPYLNMNNDGVVLYKYAFSGSFEIAEKVCRDFIDTLYEDGGPDVLRLYDTGVNFVLLHLVRAWNVWHERTANVRKSLVVMCHDRKAGTWIPHPWYLYRA